MFQGTEVSAQIKFQGTEVRILSLGKVGVEHLELESTVSRESSARFDSLTHGEPSFTWFHRVSYYLGLERILRVKVARDLGFGSRGCESSWKTHHNGLLPGQSLRHVHLGRGESEVKLDGRDFVTNGGEAS